MTNRVTERFFSVSRLRDKKTKEIETWPSILMLILMNSAPLGVKSPTDLMTPTGLHSFFRFLLFLYSLFPLSFIPLFPPSLHIFVMIEIFPARLFFLFCRPIFSPCNFFSSFSIPCFFTFDYVNFSKIDRNLIGLFSTSNRMARP